MKIWFESSYSWLNLDEGIYFAIGTYKHSSKWKGRTVFISIFSRIILLHWVRDYKTYCKYMRIKA
jgi:hypothetical protein